MPRTRVWNSNKMGKKDKKGKKGKGAEKTAAKTEKKMTAKQKKDLAAKGEVSSDVMTLKLVMFSCSCIFCAGMSISLSFSISLS